MAIYDYDGTTSHPLGKVYDYDGTTSHPLGKVYDYDGTTSYPIYSAEKVLLDGTANQDKWTIQSYGNKTEEGIVYSRGDKSEQTIGRWICEDTFSAGEFSQVTTHGYHNTASSFHFRVLFFDSAGNEISYTQLKGYNTANGNNPGAVDFTSTVAIPANCTKIGYETQIGAYYGGGTLKLFSSIVS